MPTPPEADEQRRRLLIAGTLGVGLAVHTARSAPSGTSSGTASPAPPAAVDEGRITGDRVDFAPIHADSEAPGRPPPNPDAPARRVGFAVMGLGRLALENILPAFAHCKHARLTGLISGTPDKMAAIADQYGITADARYGYGDLAKLRTNAAIQAVYVVLPNALHRRAVLDLAGAGKHVLCEKPMAVNADEARDMIEACRRAGRKLMIAYRCQYETANRELARRARAGEFGQVQFIDAVNMQNQGDPTQWRQIKALSGGGSLPDVGLYCLNSARALLGEEPVEITAMIHTPDDARFKEVESTVSFTLRFPSGVIANCATSYSLHEKRWLSVNGSKGHAYIANAFAYEGQRLHVSQREGQAEVEREIALGVKNQFALEMDHFALCIRNDTQPRTPGEEGLQDQRIMAAIYESARTGQPVKLDPATRLDAFRGPPLS